MKNAKEKWIRKQCVSIENNLKNNNTKMAYQTVKELTKGNFTGKDAKIVSQGPKIRLHFFMKNSFIYSKNMYSHTRKYMFWIINTLSIFIV